MKAYRVNVNGNVYEITIEVIDKADIKAAPAPAPEAAPAPQAAPAPAGNGEAVSAPLPGVITRIAVSNGQAVKKGDLLATIEAMKMETEILSPADGTIASVHVTQGASVEGGAVLFTFA